MNPAVSFHRLATHDYLVAKRWYHRRSPVSATRFDMAVSDAITRVTANSKLGSPFAGNCRWVRVVKFPFSICYEELSPNHIVVFAVAHHRRKSGYWLGRRNRP